MGLATAQITVDPAFPTQTSTVTITYDATEGTAGLEDCNCDVYIHTGLITAESTTPSDWKFVRTVWGQANPAWRMTRVPGEDNLYRITIDIPEFYDFPPGTVVRRLAMVFRDATGAREGKADGGADIFYDLVQPGSAFQVRLESPASATSLVEAGTPVAVRLVSSEPVASFVLTADGVEVDRTSGGSTYATTLTAAPGLRRYRLTATTSDGDTASVTFVVFGLANLAAVGLPRGIEPGYTPLSPTRGAFYLYAPGKSRAIVRLSVDGFELAGGRQLAPLTNGLGFYLELDVPNNEGFSYQYLVDGLAPVADPFSELVLDPFHDRFIRGVGWDSIPALPAGIGISTWVRPERPFTWTDAGFVPPADKELVIYELLVRDFTEAHSYQSLIDSLGYFERLGINAIELMPVNEFEGNESWGYNPSYHMALDKYYGPPEDLKAFVDAAHAAGIAVIVDVVFNHGFGQNPYVQLYAAERAAAPNGAGPFYNVSARHPFNVGTDANHESIHTKRYTGRILRYLLEEFHLDGFRFDLSKGFTQRNTPNDVGAWSSYDASRIAILNAYRDSVLAVDPDAYVILEHFADNREEAELTAGGAFVWGNMTGAYADAAVGRANDDLYGVTPESRGFDNPRLVGYMESHDEERLMHRILTEGARIDGYDTRAYSTAHERAELASAFFYTTPGAKMLWQFGEYGYPVDINFNGRTGNKPILWELLDRPANRRLFNVTASLIKLRRDYPVFACGDHNLPEGLAEPGVKSLEIRHPDMDAVVVGNFRLIGREVESTFPGGGTYYDYFSGDSLVLGPTGSDITTRLALDAGEYRVYTSERLPVPQGGYPQSSSSVAEGLPAGATVRLLGNPTKANPVIAVTGWTAARLTLEVYDATGRGVLAQAVRTDGHSEIDAARLTAGSYIVTVCDERGRTWSGWLVRQ